jgi:hypothetical protein
MALHAQTQGIGRRRSAPWGQRADGQAGKGSGAWSLVGDDVAVLQRLAHRPPAKGKITHPFTREIPGHAKAGKLVYALSRSIDVEIEGKPHATQAVLGKAAQIEPLLRLGAN